MMFPGEGSFVKSEQLTLTMSSGLSQHVLGDIHFLFFTRKPALQTWAIEFERSSLLDLLGWEDKMKSDARLHYGICRI